MSRVSQALAALKPIIMAINPTPARQAAAVYTYPADNADIRYDAFPVVIISQDIFVPGQQRLWATDTVLRRWAAEIKVLLKAGMQEFPHKAAELEEEGQEWVEHVGRALRDNPTLSDTVIQPGDLIGGGGDAVLLDDFIGNMGWDGKLFFGVDLSVLLWQEI